MKTKSLPACHIKSELHSAWLTRVAELEAEGCDTSDAQAIADSAFLLDTITTNSTLTAL